jgi:polar amino acid transport system permease protein|tara:strand:+ start:10445 stop:11098 length:654 start_codon:yes stop_codon:yes gene_type:complete
MGFTQILVVLGQGVGYTVLITLACSLTGVLIGLVIVGLRKFEATPLNILLDVFTYVFRAIPMLVLLFIVYFGLSGFGFRVSPMMAMVLSLGVIAGAYIGEVFRGALHSVDNSEVLAAYASGMSKAQVLIYIEMPQMLRLSMPGMVNEFTTVLKYSPFAYTVGIPEITKQAMALVGTTNQDIEIYLATGILYFIIYRILLAGLEAIERHFRIPGMTPI